MAEYLLIAENITFKNNKLSCINVYESFSAVALPAEFVFDLVAICGPNWTPGEHKVTIKAQTSTGVSFDIGEIMVNIPNENFVYNALAPNLKLGLDYSIKDITIFVYDNDKEILSRKYVVNSLLVPQKKAPAKSSEKEKEKASSKKNA